ncbi:MAG TPA: M20/M25/M40 family metallo-hydrolase [Kofleriaceae bacterium]|nr:M20/M25/M40 family metallo-hydrolase [Kofleriaceae bacterium]
MSARGDGVAAWLARLIEVPTHNPGGDEPALARLLAEALAARGADEVEVELVPRPVSDEVPPGTSGAYVYARWGQPRLLVNTHIDTVPPNRSWSRDPFAPLVDGDRLVGLGSADTKGAAAAILCALEREQPRDVAVLFSGDEEFTGTCARAFLASPRAAGIERALVSEPTRRRVGVRHRGVACFRAEVASAGGHSSRADRLPKPIVALARLAVELDGVAGRWIDRGPPGMTGLCMNVASIDGGVAFNVVPERAALTFSFRAPPGCDRTALDRDLVQAVASAALEQGPSVKMVEVMDRPPFATAALDAFAPLLGELVDDPVQLDFWTEAAVMAEAGIDAVVIGPGDIAVAHGADEWVPLADLDWAVDTYASVFARTRRER